MDKLEYLEKEIKHVKERNKIVEADKAWEVSVFRRIIITIITYITVVIFLVLVDLPNPFVSAIIPTAGFLLSTLTMPFFKKNWIDKILKK